MLCWFHGSGERKADDVRIEGARKQKGMKRWSDRFVLADTPGYPDCNPVFYVDQQDKLWLFWITVLSNHWESSLLKYRTSNNFMQKDGAPEWDWQDNIHITPQNFADDLRDEWDRFIKKFPDIMPSDLKPFAELTADEFTGYYMKRNVNNKLTQRLGWMTRIHPLTLPSGRILLPLYTDAFSISIIAISDDRGKTWQTSHPLAGFGGIQPSLIRMNDGTIAAMMRENGPHNRIRISKSVDEGMTWGRVSEMEIPNPGSSVEVIRLANGNWLLMCNDTTDGRHSLNLFLSSDEGRTWPLQRHLELGKPGEGSFSYPSLIQTRDGMIHATYSYHLPENKKSIKHAEFNLEWVIAGDPK